jgi:hypothetical protein
MANKKKIEIIEVLYLNYPDYSRIKYGGRWVKPDIKTTTARIIK